MPKKSILLVGIVMILIMNGVYSHPIGRFNSPELFNISLALNYVNIYYSPYTKYLIYEENSTYLIYNKTPEYTTIYKIGNNNYWLYFVKYISTEEDNNVTDLYRNFKHPKYKFYENQEIINIFFLKNKPTNCYGFECEYNFGKVTHHEKAIGGTHWY